MTYDPFIVGYSDHPFRWNYPKPGTQAETLYLQGWQKAQRETLFSDDQDWAFGRETFFANYDKTA